MIGALPSKVRFPPIVTLFEVIVLASGAEVVKDGCDKILITDTLVL